MKRSVGKTGPLILFSSLTIVAGITVALAASGGPAKGQADPEAGMSDQQRSAIHAQAHALNDQYLRQFVARGSDPRGLPVVEVATYAAAPATLAEAAGQADLIVRVKVRSVTFQSDPAGGLPLATATADVVATAKGQSTSTILVRQLGGPVAQGSGGALAMLDSDPLVLSGDDAVLLLSHDSANSYRTVNGAGVNLVHNGVVRAQDSNPFASQVNARVVDDLLQTLRGQASS